MDLELKEITKEGLTFKEKEEMRHHYLYFSLGMECGEYR